MFILGKCGRQKQRMFRFQRRSQMINHFCRPISAYNLFRQHPFFPGDSIPQLFRLTVRIGRRRQNPADRRLPNRFRHPKRSDIRRKIHLHPIPVNIPSMRILHFQSPFRQLSFRRLRNAGTCLLPGKCLLVQARRPSSGRITQKGKVCNLPPLSESAFTATLTSQIHTKPRSAPIRQGLPPVRTSPVYGGSFPFFSNPDIRNLLLLWQK